MTLINFCIILKWYKIVINELINMIGSSVWIKNINF